MVLQRSASNKSVHADESDHVIIFFPPPRYVIPNALEFLERPRHRDYFFIRRNNNGLLINVFLR